jgi:hypothetical protein
MLHLIKKVEYVEDYKLKLTFNDKKQKIVDLKKYSNEGAETVFYPFRDLAFFKSVKLDRKLGTIVWPNGVDLCPDTLYMRGLDVSEEEQPTKLAQKSSRRKKYISSVTIETKPSIAAKPKH